MKFKSGLIVGGLVVASVMTNPNKETHARKVTESTISPFVEGGSDNPISRIGGAFADAFSDTLVDYHNFYLFSTTTSPASDKRLSIGAFGYVHVEQGEQRR